jgi:ankyrin repeat protein
LDELDNIAASNNWTTSFESQLFEMCLRSKEEAVHSLLSSESPDIATALVHKDKHGRTPLHCAVGAGNLPIIEDLLKAAKILNIQVTEERDLDKDTPMFYARSRDVVKLLIKYGANPNALNKLGGGT